MLRGLTTVSFWADDVIAARDWYAEVLGIEPYFQRPEEGPLAYIEFRDRCLTRTSLVSSTAAIAPPHRARVILEERSSTGRSTTCRLRLTGCSSSELRSISPSPSKGQPASSRPPSWILSVTFWGLMPNPDFVAYAGVRR